MRILAIDIGTGTQDIVLFDSTVEPENCFKLIMPAPTQILATRVRQATRERKPLLLTGSLMGGGPVGWAVEAHLAADLPVYAEPDAARTLNDDLDRVRALGIHVLQHGDDLPGGAVVLQLKDLDLAAITAALASFGLEPRLDGLAVAVLDHGDAPPETSDRKFRFQHIQATASLAASRVGQSPETGLLSFAYTPAEVPAYLTRMRAVASCAPPDVPLVLLDTGPAAALGALQDPHVGQRQNLLLVNVGNMHTLAAHIVNGQLVGILEHHTHRLTSESLVTYLRRFAARKLTNDEVFVDHGHGCFLATTCPNPRSRPFVAVTGPRRRLLGAAFHSSDFAAGSPYFAVPHGDMMTTGCWGLVRAFAAKYPTWEPEIRKALGV